METLFSVTHPDPTAKCAAHVLRPIRTLFFFHQNNVLKLCVCFQTLRQHLENPPANGGSVVSRARVLLLATWTGFYYFLRQKTEIDRREKTFAAYS